MDCLHIISVDKSVIIITGTRLQEDIEFFTNQSDKFDIKEDSYYYTYFCKNCCKNIVCEVSDCGVIINKFPLIF